MRLVGVRYFRAGGEIDGDDEANSHYSQFYETPKKILIHYQVLTVNNYFFISAIFVYSDSPRTWLNMLMKSYLSSHVLSKISQAITFRFYNACK